MRGYLILFLLSIMTFTSFTQDRALYVNNFSNILGSRTQENKLLQFALLHQFNSLILYDLHKINKRFPLEDASQNEILANFIKLAKTRYGIKKISASGESGGFFIEAIHPYNLSRKDRSERFDIYNLEYEYWDPIASSPGEYYCENYLKKGQLPCNRNGSFKYFIESLLIMKLISKELDHPIEIEAYVGHFNPKEVANISGHVDLLLIHSYVQEPNRIFPYIENRLDYLYAINSRIEISVLLSAEMNFLGKWMKDNYFKGVEEIFLKELQKKNMFVSQPLNFNGFTYYNYSYLDYALKVLDSKRGYSPE